MTEKLNMQALASESSVRRFFLLLTSVYSTKLFSTKNQEAVI